MGDSSSFPLTLPFWSKCSLMVAGSSQRKKKKDEERVSQFYTSPIPILMLAHIMRLLSVLRGSLLIYVIFSHLSFCCRAYLDVKELKNRLQLDGSTHLNIFFANSSEEELAGVATWPWDKEALVHLGKSLVHQKSSTVSGQTTSCSHSGQPDGSGKLIGRRQRQQAFLTVICYALEH